MPVIRAFIAIQLPISIQTQLDEIARKIQGLAKVKAIRWVQAKNIHLTLKFLGDVSSNNVNLLAQSLNNEISRHQGFEISLSGVGAFPNLRRPRVVWVGIETQARLLALQKGIDAETIRLGYPSEERAFSPHLTLARISQNASPDDVRQVGEALAGLKIGLVGKFYADAVHLYRSDLQPGGAIYTSLNTFALSEVKTERN
jgi:2'-5' RNA ligase